ncbi:hypothetical protein A7C99_7088 [Trichophyton rubrum]|uniref:Uncharacterized protein n=1 Tax=Trichophyton rubrum TaxID=5551 RepID=A0A178ER26_TRIRU|nr:hypothetical protein A7C99_7088 [Trichophyton rubrum]
MEEHTQKPLYNSIEQDYPNFISTPSQAELSSRFLGAVTETPIGSESPVSTPTPGFFSSTPVPSSQISETQLTTATGASPRVTR